ncbi:MAG: hypothetical protein HPY83_11005 [Anaerolineae bacterium]|nr:hypothetical protein [Anaerolineae bacterium]
MDGATRATVRQSLRWGEIDSYVLLPSGNGDITGLFDPFAGKVYDELRYSSGKQRDMRTLLLSRLFSQDY